MSQTWYQSQERSPLPRPRVPTKESVCYQLCCVVLRALSGRAPPRGLSLPREGAWIETEIFLPPQKLRENWSPDGETDRKRRADPHPARILAFQPECNPPAHTTGRVTSACNTAGAAGGRHGADPAELGTHSERFSPIHPPSGERTGSTTLRAPPPAQPLLAPVTRCGNPRIGTRHIQPRPPPQRGTHQGPMITRDTGLRHPQPRVRARKIWSRDSPAQIGTVGRAARRPAAATQKFILDQYWANQPRVTPSAPVGTEQLVRPHRSWAQTSGRGGGVFPRNPSPT